MFAPHFVHGLVETGGVAFGHGRGDACAIGPAGPSCSGGSHKPTRCLPGSIGPTPEMETCDLCELGKFQRNYEQTACELCTPGFYCKQGAAEPVPCPGGYVGNATGLYSPGQCTPVPLGFWAPLGSNIPEPCPTSGFYCPGALRDTVHGGARRVGGGVHGGAKRLPAGASRGGVGEVVHGGT